MKYTYELSETEQKNYLDWVKTLPKKGYRKMKYQDWFMFGQENGIGISVLVRREYDNGDIFNGNITDYDKW